MEIEAKFRAPDADLLYRLGEASQLAGYPIFAGRTELLRDTYLDTERWHMLTAGYACRRRLVDYTTYREADCITTRRLWMGTSRVGSENSSHCGTNLWIDMD